MQCRERLLDKQVVSVLKLFFRSLRYLPDILVMLKILSSKVSVDSDISYMPVVKALYAPRS